MTFTAVSLLTSAGLIEDLTVLRDRAGEFHTHLFERYCRDVPQIARGLTQMFVAGASTQKGGEVAQTLMGVTASARRQPIESDANTTIRGVA